MRKRAELFAHIQNTNSQYNLPEIGKKIAYKANRDGVAERFADPAVQKSIEVDLALIDHYDGCFSDMELTILKTAKQHDANTLYLLRTVPGIGKILSLVLLYEIHDIERFPRVQDFVSYCRLVKCAKESAGKRYGHLRHEDRQRVSQVGLLRSGRAVPAGESGRAKIPRPAGEKTWQGQSLDHLGPQAGARSLLHDASATWRSRCTSSLPARGAERVSLAPNWTPYGMSLSAML